MPKEYVEVAVLISADVEWRVIRQLMPNVEVNESPLGEYFHVAAQNGVGNRDLIFFHGGWGKISAAASTQYTLDRWKPRLLVNLGTCGGFEGEIEKGTIVLVERTSVYDIYEQMGDVEAHISHYTTELDLSWLREPYPEPVYRGLLVSGDRDLQPDEINLLKHKFGAVAGDWESGAIAYVAKRNNAPCLILRGVSDIVGDQGSEAYADIGFFEKSAEEIMTHLVDKLPGWIESAGVFRN